MESVQGWVTTLCDLTDHVSHALTDWASVVVPIAAHAQTGLTTERLITTHEQTEEDTKAVQSLEEKPQLSAWGESLIGPAAVRETGRIAPEDVL